MLAISTKVEWKGSHVKKFFYHACTKTEMHKLERILPRYSRVPLLVMFAANFVAYYGSRLLAANLPHISMALPLDEKIPFCPEFIYIYILAYVQWAIGFLLIARESPVHCYRIMNCQIAAKLICTILFIAVPTTILRPQVIGNSVTESLVRLIYWTDSPTNLFPSIHCLDSYLCFRGALGLRRVPRWYAPIMLFISVLVFSSTVLVKQHVIVDIPAGILAGELGWFVSGKFQFHHLVKRIQSTKKKREGSA